MLAIIEDSCKQYRVREGEVLEVELKDGLQDGRITFDKVCLVEDPSGRKIGTPYVQGAKVSAVVLAEVKGEKKIAMHLKHNGSRVRKGHRQRQLRIRIEKIEA